MRTKKIKYCVAASGLFILLASSVLANPLIQMNQFIERTDIETAVPRSDYIVWRYKTENGKMYKRLYNTSTCQWVGDWIYVCDV